jgi:hypothetical protein
MMAATPTKLSSEADVGRSKAQHVVILAFCSKIAGITYSASPNTALDPRLGAKTGLNDEVFVNKLTASVPNGKCQLICPARYATVVSEALEVILRMSLKGTGERR